MNRISKNISWMNFMVMEKLVVLLLLITCGSTSLKILQVKLLLPIGIRYSIRNTHT
uniref:Uncharacterized protein n=1 Tax=Anguilla anguilla TaxID=7936 RepID=A0A0E9QZ61_ANGAN